MDGEFKDLNQPSKASIVLLSGILLGFALLATIIIASLVDPLSRYRSISYDRFKITNILLYLIKIRRESAAGK